MMALGAAHVMMMASDDDDADSSQPESTLRGGYRRRSVFGRRPVQRRQAGGSGGQGGITATNVLLALNAIVYLFQMRYPAITKAGWKMAPAITQQGQWYRLLTPIVLHGSFTHLAVNSMSFSSVGPVVERVMGKAKFVTVYTLAGIAGNVLSCIVNPRTPSVGASGAIFGMVGAWGFPASAVSTAEKQTPLVISRLHRGALSGICGTRCRGGWSTFSTRRTRFAPSATGSLKGHGGGVLGACMPCSHLTVDLASLQSRDGARQVLTRPGPYIAKRA
ncbi:unnamed protein product, partial [Ectocarpus sp. 6 AP-2014]